MILGHEASGVVAEVGANLADRFKVSHRGRWHSSTRSPLPCAIGWRPSLHGAWRAGLYFPRDAQGHVQLGQEAPFLGYAAVCQEPARRYVCIA